jgi:hypothetical protein
MDGSDDIPRTDHEKIERDLQAFLQSTSTEAEVSRKLMSYLRMLSDEDIEVAKDFVDTVRKKITRGEFDGRA